MYEWCALSSLRHLHEHGARFWSPSRLQTILGAVARTVSSSASRAHARRPGPAIAAPALPAPQPARFLKTLHSYRAVEARVLHLRPPARPLFCRARVRRWRGGPHAGVSPAAAWMAKQGDAWLGPPPPIRLDASFPRTPHTRPLLPVPMAVPAGLRGAPRSTGGHAFLTARRRRPGSGSPAYELGGWLDASSGQGRVGCMHGARIGRHVGFGRPIPRRRFPAAPIDVPAVAQIISSSCHAPPPLPASGCS